MNHDSRGSRRWSIGRVRRRHHAAMTLPLIMAVVALLAAAASARETVSPRRIGNRSPLFEVGQDAVAYHMDYTGFVYADDSRTDGERQFHGGIEPKMLEMIAAAETHIILSVFLFDSLYADDPEGHRDVVGSLTHALLARREACPDIRIALILDPSHAAYAARVSPAERILRDHGVDVFYSDLLADLKKASFFGVREGLGTAGRVADRLTFNLWGNLSSSVFHVLKLPVRFDDEFLSLEGAYNATLMKANHRKLLVCDVHGSDWEALISTANPHNASAAHVNSAISVRGAPARYVYNLLREDMRWSIGLDRRFVHWSTGADRGYRRRFDSVRFPALPSLAAETPQASSPPPAEAPPPARVRIVTEDAIRDVLLELLEGVEADDEVRILLFYLAFEPVVEAVLDASRRVDQPIRLLLDPNKDSFNKEKDGTPNRQVARYLLREAAGSGGKLEIRWYDTHGEQNHAKTMAIRNTRTGHVRVITGSANWTGRNLDGVNMESNVVVENAPGVHDAFASLFDRFWTNSDGVSYSLDYEAFQDAASEGKWRRGDKPWYWSTF